MADIHATPNGQKRLYRILLPKSPAGVATLAPAPAPAPVLAPVPAHNNGFWVDNVHQPMQRVDSMMPDIESPNNCFIPRGPGYGVSDFIPTEFAMPVINSTNFAMPGNDSPRMAMERRNSPNMTTPFIHSPNMMMPGRNSPSMMMPAINPPNMAMQGMESPNMTIPYNNPPYMAMQGSNSPNMMMPGRGSPNMTIPYINSPDMAMQGRNSPNMAMSIIESPNMVMSAVNSPNWGVPDINSVNPVMPVISSVNSVMPVINSVNSMMPDINSTNRNGFDMQQRTNFEIGTINQPDYCPSNMAATEAQQQTFVRQHQTQSFSFRPSTQEDAPSRFSGQHFDFAGGMNQVMSDQSPGSDPSPSPPAEMRAKVPIPRQVPHLGPASKNYNPLPRAKPGRKPLSGNTNDKRKDQNRNAQRAFRDRRAQRAFDLEEENARIKVAHSNELASRDDMVAQLQTAFTQRENQNAQLRAENSQLKVENSQLKSENAQLKADVAQRDQMNSRFEDSQSMLVTLPAHHQQAHASYPVGHPTPPEDRDDDMETDFTSMFARKPAFSDDTDTMGIDDQCGFCTTPHNCLCKQSKNQKIAQLPPISEERTHPNPIQHTENTTTPSFMEAPTRATGPGMCDDCIADPIKARQCRELAERTHFRQQAISSSSSLSSPSSSSTLNASTGSDGRMPCNDFLTQAKAKNVQLGPENYARFQVFPYSHGNRGNSTNSPAMEIDAQDAAQALAAMSRGERRSDMS